MAKLILPKAHSQMPTLPQEICKSVPNKYPHDLHGLLPPANGMNVYLPGGGGETHNKGLLTDGSCGRTWPLLCRTAQTVMTVVIFSSAMASLTVRHLDGAFSLLNAHSTTFLARERQQSICCCCGLPRPP